MKNLFLALFVFLASLSTLTAQEEGGSSFNEGDFVLNVGIGYFSPYSVGLIGAGLNTWALPAVQVSGEVGLKKLGPGVLGIGGSVGHQLWLYNESGYNWNWHNVVVGPRVTYHLGELINDPKWDVYGGLQLGVRINSFNGDGFGVSNDVSVYGYYSFIAGGRYYIGNKFGLFAEVGYDITWLKAGVAFKL